uniref:Uncharacterized protein LOC114328934 n=1 Tax=Diabrotica virgifera virgifera TaxID=50390 RepID=A0A6P7FDG7_DIAVI
MDELKELMELVKSVMLEVKELRQVNQYYIEKFKDIQTENIELKKQLVVVQNRMEIIEKKERQNNLIITGLDINETEPEKVVEETVNNIKKYLKVEAEINRVTKIGNKRYKVEMVNLNKKKEILSNKKKLKDVPGARIFIDEDLTYQERRIQKIIREQAKLERNQGKNVKVAYKKMIVNNQVWVWNRQSETLEEQHDHNKIIYN